MAKSISRYLADISSTSGVLDGTLSTAAQTNITSLGTLSSLTVSGSAAMTLTTAAQPNITSVGTLSSLTVSGNTNATLTTAAQPNITSVGTLTALTGGTGDLTWDTNTLFVDSSANKIGIGTLFTGGNANAVMTAPLNIKLTSGSSAPVATFSLEHLNQSASVEQRLQFNIGDDATADSYSNAGYIAFGKENDYVTDSGRDSYLSFATATNAVQAERMRITSAGRVGLGGQTAPKEVLNVAGAGVFEGDHSTGVNAMNAGTGVLVHASGSVGYITATSSGSNNRDLQIRALNAGAANAGQLTLHHTGASTFTGPAAATFTVKSTDDAASTPGPHIILRRDAANPADGDDVGELQWIGKNNAAEDVILAMMRTWNRSVTDGSEGSSFGLYDRQGGTQTGILFADNNTIHLNHSGVSRPIQFRGEGNVYSRIAHHSYGMSFETTTSDGSDNLSVSLDAGSGAGSTSRGAFFGCYGNEASTHGGSIVAQLGASGDYKFYGGSGADKVFHLNGAGAAGLEMTNSRFIVGNAYNTHTTYNQTSGNGQVGIYGKGAYSSCDAHIEVATSVDAGWAPIYLTKFNWSSGEDGRFMQFINYVGTSADYGTITYDGTNYAITNSSDYRLKENIVDYSGGLAKLEELKVRSFNKKEGPSKGIKQEGFIAHEASTANIPGFIIGEKDAMKVDESGETVPKYQEINKEALIPYLVSAIQELSAKVKELEAK